MMGQPRHFAINKQEGVKSGGQKGLGGKIGQSRIIKGGEPLAGGIKPGGRKVGDCQPGHVDVPTEGVEKERGEFGRPPVATNT